VPIFLSIHLLNDSQIIDDHFNINVLAVNDCVVGNAFWQSYFWWPSSNLH